MRRSGAVRLALCMLFLFLLLATCYNSIVPLGEGPDELGHMAYVLFLARERRLPVQHSKVGGDVPGEGHQPPLAYLLALPAVIWLPPHEQHLFLSANPNFVWNGGDQPAAFMRFSREFWPWHGVVLAWHLVRGVSTLLGMLTVVCVWQAARALAVQDDSTPGTAVLPWLAAALVAFNPQFLFTSALVTNDALLVTLSAGLFWLCVSWTADDPLTANRDVWSVIARPLLAGGVLGLALLTKQNALLLVPLLVWASWRASGGCWRSFVRHVLIWAGSALVVAGWWYLRNWAVYGDPFGLAVFRAEFTTQSFDWRSQAAWRAALGQLHASFWARFGWLSLRPPEWVNWFYGTLGLVALAGLMRTAFAHRQLVAHPLRWLNSPWVAVLLLPLLAFAWTVSFALTAGLVAWQGRMLFPALPALAIFLARGLMVWLPRGASQPVLPRGHLTVSVITTGVLLVLALYLPLLVIRPAYHWYSLPPLLAQAGIQTPTVARFAQSWERGVELRGWRLNSSLQPGSQLTLTLTWHALEYVPRDWTIFVHLVDADEQLGAEDSRRPHDGAFPMPRWTPGDWVETVHPLWLPPNLPAGRYELRVGLYQPEQQGRRQYTRTANGDPLNTFAVLGILEIGP